MTDAVIKPVVVMLTGAVLIAAGMFSASSRSPGVGIVLAIAGIATLILGIIMLFTLAQERNRSG